MLVVAITFATYAWSMEIGRRVHAPLNAALMRLYAQVAHPHERTHVNSGTWYATALVLLALLATRPATMAALAVCQDWSLGDRAGAGMSFMIASGPCGR